MNYTPIYCDTEGAIDIEFVRRLGVDTKNFRIENINTVEEFCTLGANLNKTIREIKDAGKIPPKVMVVLDSLGNLTSNKEKADTISGSEKRDMTKQQAIRRLFRVIGNDFAKNAIPFIICNHVYAKIGSFFPGNEISGGGGVKFNSSIIHTLSIKQLTDKDSEEATKKSNIDAVKVGVIVAVKPFKQRFTRLIKVEIHIPFYKQPNPYVGLEKFISWKNCGILRGKIINEKTYLKLKEEEQALCHAFEKEHLKQLDVTEIKNLSSEDKKKIKIINGKQFIIEKLETLYAFPKDTSRTLVCRHLQGEIPLKELFTSKVFTQEILEELDENIIKPTFQLPSIESMDDILEVTESLDEKSINLEDSKKTIDDVLDDE